MRALGSGLAVAVVLAGTPGPAGASPPGAGPNPVVGGAPAEAGRWDDAAAVYFGDTPGCTGTLIAPDLVLTAGHCVAGVSEVKLGVTNLSDQGEVIPVTRSVEYPDSFTTFDVGIFELEQPSQFTPRVLATGCVLERFLENRAPVAIVGWGATDQRGEQTTSLLMEGQSEIRDVDCVTGRGCNESVSPGGELVAGGDNVDSCFGDSGGPLYLLTDIGEFLVGVTSRGFDDAAVPCGEGGIYVRPDAVLDWIEEQSGRSIPRATCNARPVPTADLTRFEVEAGDSVDAQVTANDPDAGDSHDYAVETAPQHGEVVVDGDGTLFYRARDDYEGEDAFTIEVSDDGIPSLSAEVAFDVTVLPGSGCGCGAGGRDPGAPLLVGLAALVGLVRRRRRGRVTSAVK